MAKKPNPPSQHGVPELLRQMRDEAKLAQRDQADLMKRAQPWIRVPKRSARGLPTTHQEGEVRAEGNCICANLIQQQPL
jgi:hypothetical protein